MGQKLVSFYDKAKKLGGLKAQIRMAIITRLPGKKASSEPDSEENIKRFEEAMKELEKEFN